MVALRVLEWLAKLPASLLVKFASYPLAPLAVAHAYLIKEWVRLPGWAEWMETPDNSWGGDDGHLDRWMPRLRWAPEWLAHLVVGTAWLWRNSAYSFDVYQLGRLPYRVDRVWGDERVSNRPWFPGWVLRLAEDGTWFVYGVQPIAGGLYLRLKAGWQIWDTPVNPLWGKFTWHLSLRLLQAKDLD